MSAFDPDGFDRVEEAAQKRVAANRNAGRPSREPIGEARPPAFSDDAMALRFAKRHAGDLRFVALWNKWLIWTGTVWRFDDTLHAFDLARVICREAAAECNGKDTLRTAIASAKTVAAVERLARADRRIAATIDQWDADPWALNTPEGVIDLRTGKARPHRVDDFMTKTTACGARGGCPEFLRFMRRITGGDVELVAYLQRVFGYGLTGLTREHALFFAHGTGANGKSVLLATVTGVLGDYHRTAPIETFVASTGERHPTDLAGLRGARLVTATETEREQSDSGAQAKECLFAGRRPRPRFGGRGGGSHRTRVNSGTKGRPPDFLFPPLMSSLGLSTPCCAPCGDLPRLLSSTEARAIGALPRAPPGLSRGLATSQTMDGSPSASEASRRR
jgi:hypothetical protein